MTAIEPSGELARRSVSSAVNCDRFGKRVNSSCVAAHLRSLTKCNASRGTAIKPQWLAVDAEVAEKYDARLVTTGDWLCG